MVELLLIAIAAVFFLAGFVKGVIGLGLPTVSMGLLAVSMPPAHALAIVIVPAIVTNIWQTFVGPYLRDIIRRLWPLMVGTAIGIWCGAGLMTGPYARYGTIMLGILLVIYAIIGLRQIRFRVAPAHEKWVGGIVGVIDRRRIGGNRRAGHPVDAVHAGDRHGKGRAGSGARRVLHYAPPSRSPSTSPAPGCSTTSTALPGVIAMAMSFTGMSIGQAVRTRMEADTFRRWFLIAMMLLGIYLAGTAIYNVLA